MNNIEEQLWNYIDGTCSTDEQNAISLLIENDEAIKAKYNQLLSLNNEFSTMELDEPSMAFTYNVMETIRTENARVPLKAAINKRIILGIAAFFIISIIVLLGFSLANINFSGIGASSVDVNFKMPNITPYFSKPVIEGFLFFDVVLGLFLFDSYLRKRKFLKNV